MVRRRLIAITLIVIMTSDIVAPSLVHALTSGPSQPEVQGFQPASADDMVDLFTGNLSYNIPLFDVEGYPVNLFYNAGVGMDQEASWVGLGWNLNPGVVERNLRGLPDDFKGDVIAREIHQKKNWTLGVGLKTTVEIFGFSPLPEGAAGSTGGGTLGISISPNFNSYEGVSVETGVSVGMRSSQGNKCQFNGELGVTSHSNRGLRMQPRVGFGRKMGSEYIAGLNFGLNLDSRQGLTNVSFGLDLTRTEPKDYCHPTNSNNDRHLLTESSIGTSTTFDIGAPTYTPEVSVPMASTALTFNVTTGGEVFGTHPNLRWRAFYSTMSVRQPLVERGAFGFFHLGDPGIGRSSMLDFNREKDGPYSPDKAALGIAQLTNDVFNVSGQGISGSYRAFRSDIGNINDPYNYSNSDGFTLGAEVGGGNVAHGGADGMVNISKSQSGKWTSGNDIAWALPFRPEVSTPNVETIFFREAGEHTLEQDPALWNAMQGATPQGFRMEPSGSQNAKLRPELTNDWYSSVSIPSLNQRTKREARSQLFSFLTHAEATKFAVEPQVIIDSNEPWAQDHHMSEVTILGDGGQRYVYGLPVYNTVQNDVEFSVGSNTVEGELVRYTATDASTENAKGREQYYSRTITPPYPYAFLLTSVLSHDYSDVDGVTGPSDGDLGNYTHFEYSDENELIKWRTPIAPNNDPNIMYAGHSRGRLADSQDDKGVYTYGEKQVKYLRTIESRNMVADFTTSPRLDCLPVGEEGHTIQDGARAQQLDRIDIYVKGRTVSGAPMMSLVKSVYFEYDYSLCPNTPNSSAATKGKLTLKKVWFTYGPSNRGRTSPYEFDYGGPGPAYNASFQDRWGCYKPTAPGQLSNKDYPYAEQDPVQSDANAGAWNLKSIKTPSGGLITAKYEADDYAYIQDKQATRMYLLHPGPGSVSPDLAPPVHIDVSGTTQIDPSNPRIYFNPPPNFEVGDERMIFSRGEVYFRVHVQMAPAESNSTGYDWVSGYCGLKEIGEGSGVYGGYDSGLGLLYADLVEVPIDEGSTDNLVLPPYRAALEYAQLNYPNLAHGGPIAGPSGEDENSLTSFFPAFANSILGLITGLGHFFNGPNLTMAKDFKCRNFDAAQCWFRLGVPNGTKQGGGHRIAEVRFSDGWSPMEPAESDEAFVYGKSYTYGDGAGSFGVASYEPLVGADENPFRRPIYGHSTRTLSPDERFYQEEPFGESMFPSASVGYSKVIVRDLYMNGSVSLSEDDPIVAQQGTGMTVHEFYTARDFPTRTRFTKLQTLPRRNKASLLALAGFRRFDHMHASQGFTVETNDMHGKHRSTSVYRQGSDEAISSIRYIYQTELENGQGPLSNAATTIDSKGGIHQAEIGRLYEMVADTREFETLSTTGGIQYNLDGFLATVFPVAIAALWPKYSSESTRFKTGTLVKKVHRSGLLKKVVKMDNGSTVTTENIAYDAHTGAVLVTKTYNDFEDPVYSMQFPAYWYYDGMGPAYMNIGNYPSAMTFNSAGAASFAGAPSWFAPGDECSLLPTNGNTPFRGWVDEVRPDGIDMIKADGTPAQGTFKVKVLRSGRRNMQGETMMKISTLHNPVSDLGSNTYHAVVSAYALEYGSEWDTDCNCTEDGQTGNLWRKNMKGIWRFSKQRHWLSDRTSSINNSNINIRRDGIYSEFSPFYKMVNENWSIFASGWSTTREVTIYGSNGQEMENRDAIGLYTSATFGHGKTLPLSIARNAKYREIGFTSFEEDIYDDCSSGQLMSMLLSSELGSNVSQHAHTGRRSLKVHPGEPIQLSNPSWGCTCEIDLVRVDIHCPSQRVFVVALTSTEDVTFSIHPESGSTSLFPDDCNLSSVLPSNNAWTCGNEDLNNALTPYLNYPVVEITEGCWQYGAPSGLEVWVESSNGCNGRIQLDMR